MRRLTLLLLILAPFLIAPRTDNTGAPTTGAVGAAALTEDEVEAMIFDEDSETIPGPGRWTFENRPNFSANTNWFWGTQTPSGPTDISVGDADEGQIRIGGGVIGMADHTISDTNFDGVMVFENPAVSTEAMDFVFWNNYQGPLFSINARGNGIAHYSGQSLLIGAGGDEDSLPEDILCVTFFSNIDCLTTGGDLGVQDDIEVLDDLFVGNDLYALDDINLSGAIFAPHTQDVYSQFGPNTSSINGNDGEDSFIVSKINTTDSVIRAFLAKGEYTGSVKRTKGGYGFNSFFFHTGTGDYTGAQVSGEVGGRSRFVGRTSTGGTTVARGGGQSAGAQLHNASNGMTLNEGFAFLAEGNVVTDATGEMTDSYNFWGLALNNGGGVNGTVPNNMGFIQQELDEVTSTTNIEFGVEGAGMFAVGVVVGVQPTEFMNQNTDNFLDFTAADAMRFGNGVDAAPTAYMAVENDADTYWVGDGTGIPYGGMYVDDTQLIVVALTEDTPTEVEDSVTSAEDGWLTGQLNSITFPTGGTEHYLTITKAGVYKITWDLSFNMPSPGANVEIHGGVAIDDTPVRATGEAHRTIANTSDTGNMGGTLIYDFPDGDEEISLWIENTTNDADAAVEHGNVTVTMVGGT